MPSIHDTAYPRLKASVTLRDLTEVYTPTPAEQTLAAALTSNGLGQAGFLILLKTFQRLGYFVPVQNVPRAIVDHLTTHVGAPVPLQEWPAYDASGTRRRHMKAIRAHCQVKSYDREAQGLLDTALRTAASTKDDVVDLINVGVEELIRQRFELPGFTTIRRTAQHERAAVNQALCTPGGCGSRGRGMPALRRPLACRPDDAPDPVEPPESRSGTADAHAVA